ncbi:MAG: T9SS type A sorting domain-containing protein, partial [Chitinophagales bacterium]
SLSQEQDTLADELGQSYQPVTGFLFGKADMGLVLRGLKINSNLSVNPAPAGSLPEGPTGLKDISTATQSTALSVFIYPNPAKESLTVDYTYTGNKKVAIELLNLLGQPMITTQLESNTGMNRIRLNTSNLAAGVYLLRVSTDSQSKTARAIIE